jgi:alkanesulfonate monooxygenase SsuD/methylene tetrahydromethanopterin reductase-like flavin-dependent oxidoreductase (luciferase family)
LGVIAAPSKALKFGSMVTSIDFRNPALLAKMACTLDSFSGGRLQLGVGAGWFETKYKAYGYEFLSFVARRQQFIEALHVLLPLVRDGMVDFEGNYFSVHTDCYPRPAGKMHVIIGGKAKSLDELLP